MLLAALALAVPIPFQAASPPAPTAHYTVALVDPAEGSVRVTLDLAGLEADPDTTVELRLPERFAFATLDEPRLEGDVEAFVERRAIPVEREGPYTWRLSPEGAPRLSASWTVPLDHRSLPEFAGDEYEAPYLRDDHGLIVGGAVFLAPVDPEPAEVAVAFELPEGWAVCSPWRSAVEPDSNVTLHRPRRWQDLHDDMIAIGAWDVVEATIGDFELSVAFAPGQGRLRAMVAPRIPPIVEAELELFGTLPNERYLFLFVEPTPGGYGGSPKSNSMTLFVAPDLPAEFAAAGVEHLIAHEYYHTWGKARVQLPDELRWVNEGFTDWYAYLVPWRLGMHADVELEATLEDKLAEYEGASARFGGALTDAGGPLFFDGGDAYSTTYAGGLVVALLCELSLRRDGVEGGLDQLMRDFVEDPRWRTGERPSLDDFLAHLGRAGGDPLRAAVEAFVTSPTTPDLVAAFAAVGLELRRTIEQVQLTPRANFTDTRVDAIDPRGCGALIGLRTGDVLREVNGRPVEGPGDIQRGFAAPVDGRLQIVLERPGESAPVRIDAPIPTLAVFQLPEGWIDRLRD